MVKTTFFSIVHASIWVTKNDVFKTLVRVRGRKGEAQDHYYLLYVSWIFLDNLYLNIIFFAAKISSGYGLAKVLPA